MKGIIGLKAVVAVAASLAVHGVFVGTWNWSVQQTHVAPAGEVLIVQLPDTATLPAYADARQTHVGARTL
jgi:hypothetical protein